MKEKIFAALKAAILVGGKTSISDKTLNTYVDSISAQITEESQITEAIKPHVSILKEIQANINAVAAESANVTKTEYEKRIKDLENKNPTPDPTSQKVDDVASQIEAVLAKHLAPLQEKLTAIETEKTQKTFLQQLGEQLKAADVPEWYSKNAVSERKFKTAEDVTRFAETLKTEWGTAKQELTNGGLQYTKPPANGGGTDNEAGVIASLIDKGTKEIIEQQKNK